MGKYSLVAVNREDKSRHIINVYDLENGEYKEKVHIKDIDFFTSKFDSSFGLIKYLNQEGIINFGDATFHIVSKYKENDLYFKAIFNSDMINNIAKTVKAGHLDVTKEGYRELIAYFYNHLNEKNFQESIGNAVTINSSVKNLMLQYIEIRDKEEIREDELELERTLKWKINEELKRYKTFRGFHIFIEQYKKYGYVSSPNRKYNSRFEEQLELQYNETPKLQTARKKVIENNEEEQKNKIILNVNDYNKEYDEFLSEEEYADAYGDKEDEFYKRR